MFDPHSAGFHGLPPDEWEQRRRQIIQDAHAARAPAFRDFRFEGRRRAPAPPCGVGAVPARPGARAGRPLPSSRASTTAPSRTSESAAPRSNWWSMAAIRSHHAPVCHCGRSIAGRPVFLASAVHPAACQNGKQDPLLTTGHPCPAARAWNPPSRTSSKDAMGMRPHRIIAPADDPDIRGKNRRLIPLPANRGRRIHPAVTQSVTRRLPTEPKTN